MTGEGKQDERARIEKLERELEYYKNRDSLTGQMNLNYAVKAFEKVKDEPDMGAVFVRVDTLRDCAAEKLEPEVYALSVTLAALGYGEVARVGFPEFMFFTKDCEKRAEDVYGYLKYMADDNIAFAVTSSRINGDFSALMKELRVGAAVARLNGYDGAVTE